MIHPLHLLLFFLIRITRGDDPNNYFVSPAETNGIRPVWTIGEEKTISWKTTQEEFNLTFWQHDLYGVGASSKGNIYSKIHSTDQISNFTWVVQLYGFDLDHSNVFFFWINPGVPGSPISFFNITRPTTTTTSITITSPTASPTTTKTSVTVSSSSVTDTVAQSTPSSSRDTAQPTTTTGQVALGIGIGIGLPVLAALTALGLLLGP
ncbi:hypothetical protein BO94DRAFT_583813 [Aspergillus sclerotioniger CBS 115572]|uniref:Uncharacterized protein n=1 Tax=Aspergillus sclerotioniger CBS 115572 TaxID=1450535 RepID=A0A317WZS8_9EURO|nr:hypothetical protein BO94DRAFT_583813 [Aspergillus sclerotioniger CBS 115572]PWY91896.1 hypothetical protein BO94DRAFT_583813 [Aspergillus sclerotioniger CBS 115572]